MSISTYGDRNHKVCQNQVDTEERLAAGQLDNRDQQPGIFHWKASEAQLIIEYQVGRHLNDDLVQPFFPKHDLH